jgi:uncharacterized protein involved in exopolysaccharide biosynthesis
MPMGSAEPDLVDLTVHTRASRSWIGLIESRRKTIVLAALVGALVGEVAVKTLPPTYEASGRLFVIPADDPTAVHGINAFDVANATLPLVVAVLRSRRLVEATVDRLRLDAAWGLNIIEARKRLTDTLTVATDRKANLLTVSFEDREPERARVVVATIADQAAVISSNVWAERDREHRHKLESELATVSAQLVAAEDELRRFRERTHVIDLPTQIKASVDEAAALERVRIEKTMSWRFARAFGENDSVEVQKGDRERNAAAVELDGLRRGKAGAGPLLPLDELPRLEVEYVRLKRSVDEQAARREMLALKVSQLVAAEARPGGLAEVIDPPTLPTRPSGPSTIKLVGAGAVLGAMIAAALVLLFATRRRVRIGAPPPFEAARPA